MDADVIKINNIKEMAVNKYVSIKIVIDKILRDHIFDGLSYESALDYIVDFFHIVGVPDMFIEKSILNIEYDNHRTQLPPDFIEMIQLYINRSPANYASGSFHQEYQEISELQHTNPIIIDRGPLVVQPDYSYKIEGDVIYFSKKKGKFSMVYRAIPVEEESGEPLIPDNPVLFRALKAYIEMQFLTILWRNNKITDKVFHHAEQEYSWAVGAYETDARQLDLAKAETFTNTLTNLIPRVNEFNHGFKNTHRKEYMRRK